MGPGRVAMAALGLVLLVLLWAWWDAGRTPLRPIEQAVPVPENME
ncbi:hypothetical protein WAB17_13275 [Parerythrobacter aurantius]